MCIPCIVFVICVSTMIGLPPSKYKLSIMAWRLAIPISIVECLYILNGKLTFQDGAFSILLLEHCLIHMPFLAQATTCFSCGRRVYWKGIISDRCPHCRNIYYIMAKEK